MWSSEVKMLQKRLSRSRRLSRVTKGLVVWLKKALHPYIHLDLVISLMEIWSDYPCMLPYLAGLKSVKEG